MAVINTSISPVENVLALINAANPTAPTPASLTNVTIGTPSSDSPSSKNTSILVTGVAGQGYSGFKLFTYDRIQISQAAATQPTSIEVETDDTDEQIAAAAIAALGVIASEVEVSHLPATEDDPRRAVVSPKQDNWLYQGSGVTLTVTTPVIPDADLSASFPNGDLDGFDPVV